MTYIKTYKVDDNTRVKIVYDAYHTTPRSRDNLWKLCIREHRRYIFPNELDFDFDVSNDDYITQMQELDKKYYMFDLDCYEHSSISFSLSWKGMQCKFDTSKWCWFIAIPKEYDWYNLDEWSESKHKKEKIQITKEEAERIASGEIKTFNQYLNGEVFAAIVEAKETRTNSKWETKEEREEQDSCWWYYDIEQAVADMVGKNIEELEEM